MSSGAICAALKNKDEEIDIIIAHVRSYLTLPAEPLQSPGNPNVRIGWSKGIFSETYCSLHLSGILYADISTESRPSL